jgi:hypothetical protein
LRWRKASPSMSNIGRRPIPRLPRAAALASAELGERIIATVATKSKKFGTQIQHDRRTNRGEVVLVD